jgi:hypothetical protein
MWPQYHASRQLTDTYIGTMYTRLHGGLDSGYLAKDNWETTAGLRFRW